MRTHHHIPAALLAFAATGPAQAQQVQGYAEVLGQGYLGVEGVPYTAVETLRPEFSAELGNRALLATTVQATFVQGRNTNDELRRMTDDAGLADTLAAIGHTWPEETNDALGVSALSDYVGVERLFVDLYLPKADLRIGRQAVNWGSALMVNPTDPFPEVLLVEPWKNRTGVNALRATVPIGDLHQGQVVVASNDTFTDLRGAVRATAVWLNTDFSLVGAWNQGFEDEATAGTPMDQANPLVGADIRGTLGVGFWLEGAVHFEETPYEELAVGVDYSFPVLESLVVAAQYYRNGRDSSDTSTAESLVDFTDSASSQTDPFAPFLTGDNYAIGSLGVGISPTTGAGALWVQNLDDGTALAVPTLSAFPSDRLSLTLAAQVPLTVWGEGGELDPAEADLLVDLTTLDGTETQLDLAQLVPSATLTLQTRFSF